MKLIVIGCILASVYSANSESLNSGQYFHRTPNNNLVQKTHVSAHGGGVYGNRQDANSQRYGDSNQINNQLSNQVSPVSFNNRNQLFSNPLLYSQNQRYGSFNQNSNSQRSQNQFNNQNQRYRNQINNQQQLNQRFNQVNQQNQIFNQVNQQNQRSQNNFNQQNQRFDQFTQQNQRFNQQNQRFNQLSQNFNQQNQASQFSHRSDEFIQDPIRQGREFQDQESQNGQRTDDGRFIVLCSASIAEQYTACQLWCQALSSFLESKCLLEAWANRNKACWNGDPIMICPA